MSLFYQHNINENTRLGIWKIEEPENYFLEKVPLRNEITHPRKRLQHLAGRHLLKVLYPDFPYAEILIADTRKPYLPEEQYHFSISHSGDFAAAIVSRKERVGIDIEKPSQKIAAIGPKFLNQREVGIVGASTEPLVCTTLIWCAKETIYKWWSYGGIVFREDIRLMPFPYGEEGQIDSLLVRTDHTYALALSYRLFGELTLVWLHREH